MKSKKSKTKATFLCFFLGYFGIHRFYTGYKISAIIQLLTLGGLAVWMYIDLFLIATDKFKDADGNLLEE